MKNTLNELLSNAFAVTIDKIPGIEFACTEAPMPGVTVTPVVNYGGNGLVKRPGTTMEFDPVTLTFILDETLAGYLDVMAWFKEYQTNADGAALLSDISVVLTHGDISPTRSIRYHDAFPVSVDEIIFSSTGGTPNVQMVRITFEINNISFDTV